MPRHRWVIDGDCEIEDEKQNCRSTWRIELLAGLKCFLFQSLEGEQAGVRMAGLNPGQVKSSIATFELKIYICHWTHLIAGQDNFDELTSGGG